MCPPADYTLPPSPCPGPQNFLPISKICSGLFSDLVLPRADDPISIYTSRSQKLSKSCCLKAAWACMSWSSHICAHTKPGAWAERGPWVGGWVFLRTLPCPVAEHGSLKIMPDFDLGHYEVLFKAGNGMTIS